MYAHYKRKEKIPFHLHRDHMVSGKQGIKKGLNMIIKNPKTVIPDGGSCPAGCYCRRYQHIYRGKGCAPFRRGRHWAACGKCLPHKNEVSFKIPEAYENPEEWNIHIAGLLEFEDGFSRSIHHLRISTTPGHGNRRERYSIALNDGYTELTLTAFSSGWKWKRWYAGKP